MTGVASSAADVALAAVDGARATLLRWTCASRPLRAIFVDRGRRLAAMQASAVLVSAALALRAPLISLWLGAALFGVPHVVAGVRAVTLRRRASRVALVCAALGALVGVSQLLGVGDGATRAFVALFAVSLGWEVLAARRRALLTAALLGALCLAVAAAWTSPRLTVVVLAHLHGLASLLYVALEARRRRLPVWPLALGVASFTVAAVSGLLDGAMATTLFAPRDAGPSIVVEALGVFPRASAALFHRALVLYAFGQSLHFAAWLRLLPEVDRRSPTPKPFRRAVAELRADFGRLTTPLLWLTGAAVLAILLGAGTAREAYFALTYFHVGLEAAALARALLAPRAAPSRADVAHQSAAPTFAQVTP